MLLTISRLSAIGPLGIGGAVGILQPGHATGVYDLTLEQIEQLRPTLVRLQSKGIISWVTTANGTSADNGAEGSTIGYISGLNLASGSFTPTVTPGGTFTSASPTNFTYLRVGNVVTFSGSISITSSGAGSASLTISVPIATTIAVGAGILTPSFATTALGPTTPASMVGFSPPACLVNTTAGGAATATSRIILQYMIG